jgi:hypothetical protein
VYAHAAAPVCVTEKTWPAIVSVPVRFVVLVFWATLNVTLPLSVPDAPLAIVNQAALLTAVQGQPVPVLRETLPLPAEDVNVWLVGVREGLQVDENENVFETALVAVPPGPTAETRASYSTPATGAGLSRLTNGARILPSASGAGLPRLTVCRTWEEPA